MDKSFFIDKVFDEAKNKNIDEFEIYFISNKNTSVKVFSGEIENFSDSQNQGISFRGKFNEKMGYSYTEKFEEEDINFLIKEAQENASVIESEDEQIIYKPNENEKYIPVDIYNSSLENITVSQIKDFLISLEKEVKSLDKRIKNINSCVFGMGNSERIIKNSKGINLKEKENIAYTYISVVAEENNIIKTGSDFKISRDFNDFNYKEIAKNAVNEATQKLDTMNIDIKESKCIIENLAFSSLLQNMSGIFSAEAVQKGISLLKNKIGEKIANDKFTLIDNPHLKDGIGSSSFDSEGVPTKYKEIITNGILNTYLYNLKTAKKDKTVSTGNASKGGYKGTIGISPFNLYVKNGEKSFDELVKDLENGIIITDFSGLHSGLNSISGDFSLSAEGFVVENGKRLKAINQMTVAGNFFELLKNIEEIGNDLKFSLSGVGSPSVTVKTLNISVD